jgi:hypothetical protein
MEVYVYLCMNSFTSVLFLLTISVDKDLGICAVKLNVPKIKKVL